MAKGTIALLAVGAALAGGGALKQSFETAPVPQPEPAKAEAQIPDLTEIGIGLGSIALVVGGVIGATQIKKRVPYKAPKIRSQDIPKSKRKYEGADEDNIEQ